MDPGKEKTVFIVVETDEGVRRSLATWLSRQSGCPGTVRFAEPKSAKKLPIGLQLLGKALDEARIFQIAHAYEQSTDWHKARPVIEPIGA